MWTVYSPGRAAQWQGLPSTGPIGPGPGQPCPGGDQGAAEVRRRRAGVGMERMTGEDARSTCCLPGKRVGGTRGVHGP
eukprot:759307-Hanusia_phi.AAC.7